MKCVRCERDNPPGQRFCGDCGAALASGCPACGALQPAGQRFCGDCGASLAVSGVARRFAEPGAYTPSHLAERILGSRSALEGEHKQVTVLFADLKGSLELLADRNPEEARALLDPVLQLMMDAVHRYEGTVNQVMGDGIMALFGAPVAHEDHAVRACYAGLRIREAVKEHAEELRRRHGVPVHVRIGLNSGAVVVRSIGNDLRMDYSAVGQTTHLAARMEQMAMPGSILITAGTLALAEGWIEVEALGSLPVKGMAEPVETYELKGAGAARTRLHVAAARGLTRFVGRDAELEQLRVALDQAGQGVGQVVAVVGEAGVGKSRLFHEFINSHRIRDWLVLQSTSVSYGKATTYLPVLDLLRAYFRLEPRDDTRTIRERVAGKVLTLDRALEDVIAPVLTLLDALPDNSPFTAVDPQQRRHRTLQALKRLLLRESRVQPLLLVFEDLHWVDSETQAFLDGLVESLPTSPVLLLLNYRPEYRHEWGGRTYYRQLRIDPLGSQGAEALLTGLVGDDPALSSLKSLLVDRTQGNPFFLEECVRTLVETQVLSGERGAYHLVRAPKDLQVPATVQAILAARIDRLPPEHKRLLQTAAVVGKDVPHALLAAVADADGDAVRQALAHLQSSEFLYEATLFPDVEYTFKHALTHEVAYGGVLGERRRALHARIADAIERLHAERLAEHIEQLAHHTYHAQLWDSAATYLRQAGKRAFTHSANREAVNWYVKALEAMEHLPRDLARLEQAVDTRLELRYALIPLADFARTLTEMRRAEVDAEALGDDRRLAAVLAALCECSRQVADHGPAQELGERALTLALRLGDPASELMANFQLAMNFRDQGDYRRAVDLLHRNFRFIGTDTLTTLGAGSGSGSWLAWCLARVGDFEDAMRVAGEEMNTAERSRRPFRFGNAWLALGAVHLFRGDLAEALPSFERGLELARTFDLPFLLPWLLASAGLAYARGGQCDEGVALIEAGVARAEAISVRSGHALRLAWLGEAYLLAGRPEEAAKAAERALALARDYGQRGYEIDALWLGGEIALRKPRPEFAAAATGYRAALNLAMTLELRPLAALCRRGLGEVHRRTNETGIAHEHLTSAVAAFREMGMRTALAQTEEELKAIA